MSELIAKMPYASICELKSTDKEGEEMLKKYSDSIRVYCSQAPDVFKVQIRTFKPITQRLSKEGKARFMIASVNLSITELEEILKYCKAQYPGSKKVNMQPLNLIS